MRKYLQSVTVVDFYGAPIYTGFDEESNKFVVPLKHIVEDHLGLDWETQREKAKSSDLYNPIVVTGKSFLTDEFLNDCALLASELSAARDMEINPQDVFLPNQGYVCLPLDELNLFLCQINPNRIAHENTRENLLRYQKECMIVLHDYWLYGAAANRREIPSMVDSQARPEDRSPRYYSTGRLERAANRYAGHTNDQGDTEVSGEHVMNFVKTAIFQIIDVDDETWDDPRGYIEYILAFMERAASDILFMCIDRHIDPMELTEVVEKNLIHCWENMGNSILSVQSPYAAFPGAGIGATKELVE